MSAVAGRVLLIPKGSYNSGITYNMLDVVTYEYDSYVAKTTTIGHDPTDTTYWQKMTDVGDDVNSLKETLTNFEESITGEVVDSEPYVLRQGLGNLADMALVGGSVAWNQLCNGSSVTVPNGHKYYMRKSGTTSIGASTGSAITGLTSGTDNVIDLTQLFGSSEIADYIYSLEQATAGAGVAWFRKYFPNAYYGYQSGKIESVNVASRKITGKNLLPPTTWHLNNHSSFDGSTSDENPSRARTTPAVNFPYSNMAFKISGLPSKVTSIISVKCFDENKAELGYATINNDEFTTLEGTHYIYILVGGANFTVNDFNLANVMVRFASVTNDTYEPYKEYTFPFDSSKQLRGIPKLVNNKLSYDGDIYTADGSVTRKYGIVDLGTLDYAYISANGYMASQNALSNAKAQGKAIVSDKFVYSNDISSATIPSFTIYTGKFYCALSGYTDPAQFKTAMSGVYLVYELATPTTESANAYQNPQRAFIDGTEEFIDYGVQSATRDVSIPVGNNTTYQLNETLPPTEDYVDGALKFKVAISALGTDESGRTAASRAYTTGEFFYKDGRMYKVLTSIAQGATFTINTNCQQTTLFAELKALAQ